MRIALAICLAARVVHAQPADAPAQPDAPPVDPTPIETRPADPPPAAPPPTDPSPNKSLTKLDTSKIEALYAKGTRHYDLGEWNEAITAFKAAYSLMPHSSFLFNLGQSYRQQGTCREATAAYKSYLRQSPDEDRSQVEQFVMELAPCVKLEEENARRLLPPPQLSTRHRRLRIAGFATMGLGALAFGGTALFASRASSLENDFESCVRTRECDLETALDLDERGRRANRNAKITAAVGGSVITIGLGIVLYTVFRAERVSVTPVPGGATFGAVARF